MPLPPKVLRKGITDMVRISDARMSGTAYGTVVLHTSPEAAAGGPLALVQNGDMIELDVPARRLHLDVSDEELARRRAAWKPLPAPERGWAKLYVEHVLQADQGADLDFLVGASGAGCRAIRIDASMKPSSAAPAILSAPRVVSDVRATLGEGLCWSPRVQALCSVDILEHRLYRDAADGGAHREWRFDETISAVAERADRARAGGDAATRPRAVRSGQRRARAPRRARAGTRRQPLQRRQVRHARPLLGRHDGLRGRGRPPARCTASTPPASATRAIDLGWIVTNGPTWTLDGRTMFVNDTVPARIVAYAFDAETGAVGASREWLRAGRRRRPSRRHDHRRRRPHLDRPLGRRLRHLPRPGDRRGTGAHRAADGPHHQRRVRRART